MPRASCSTHAHLQETNTFNTDRTRAHQNAVLLINPLTAELVAPGFELFNRLIQGSPNFFL